MNVVGEGACIAVAYSGGRDSTALLHTTAVAALGQPGLRVVALHVHHGLSQQADQWLAHAQAQCDAWALQGLPVSLLWRRLSLDQVAGDSVEALARAARYRALTEMAHEAGADTVLLAHHRRDQAETFLLQALRGAGISGLSAMPAVADRHGIRWTRPWLTHPRQAIEAYVAQHGLSHVEDDSNADPRFARNRLRLTVWPALEAAFGQAEVSLAQSASRAADARACLDDWLTQSLAGLLVPEQADALSAPALLALPLPHQRELLRHWFTTRTARHLPASAVARLTQELPPLVDTGRSIQWRAGAFDVCLYRGVLICRPAVLARHSNDDAPDAVLLGIEGPGRHALPEWGGELVVSAVDSGGVPLSSLAHAQVRAREGGENFQLGPNRPSRALRKQFQAQAVPEWERFGPLVYAQGRLVFVRGLGVDARVLAAPGEPQVTLIWVPNLTI
ncbi:tRNA lysidine(34) synthetase TilS [Aquabacterium sp.]|uniref:tRNA lysidine(34) synthetase TilS n=1 Tax=Aquabacterium sp. TaxID=1872578 RepID=UPI0019A6C569|nr:tRNA lysidine(34) synthetase TilS [Aquabacterium sp.]MBC7699221.1 tRNA lysidine(34) synthetase TilS [Aquabacterium sp.]